MVCAGFANMALTRLNHMFECTKHIFSGLLVALFGVWLYNANKTCCPLGVTIGVTIACIGFGYFCISLIKWNREDAKKERIRELKGEPN